MAETSTGYHVEDAILVSLAGSIRTRAGEVRTLAGGLGGDRLDRGVFGHLPWVSEPLYQRYVEVLDAAVGTLGEYAGTLDSGADFLDLVRRSTSTADQNVFSRFRSLAPNTGFGK